MVLTETSRRDFTRYLVTRRHFTTIMHSSRMRTVRLFDPIPACIAGGYLPGGVPAWGYLPRGVCTCQGCTCQGIVPAQGGVPAQDYLPRLPPPCERNDRQVQKYYLAPNFVCGR